MSTNSPQVSWDNRPVIAKRRRAELYGFLDHLNIPYPVGCPKNTIKPEHGPPVMGMMERLEAAGIDINIPHDYFQWSVITAKDEHGMPHQHVEAVTTPHETARLRAEGHEINYDKVIAERAAAVAEAEEQAEQLEAQEATLSLIMAKLEQLEANSLPLSSMSPPQLKGIAKRRGLDATGLKTKAELIALLEG